MSDEQFWVIRSMRDTDQAYISKCWLTMLDDYAQHSKACQDEYIKVTNRRLGSILVDDFYVKTHLGVTEVLDRAHTLVACHAEEPDLIIGFITGEVHTTGPLVIHAIYTKSRYRNMGVARSLYADLQSDLQSEITDPQVLATAITPSVRLQINRKKILVIPFSPFMGRKGRDLK